MEIIKEKYLVSENFNTKVLINEDWIENSLLIAGFVPVVGEIADVILIIKFLKEKRYIEAGLMLFALIPTVGDFIVKPFLKIGKSAGAFSTAGKFGEFLSKNPAARSSYAKMGKYFNNSKISGLIEQVGKLMPGAAKQMNKAKGMHINFWGRVVETDAKKGIGSFVKQAGRKTALEKYLIKTNGVPPTNFLSSWWNVVYKGSRNRRNMISKAILGSNVLHSVGIFSIQDLENKMSNETEAAQLLQNPKFKQFYDQVNGQTSEQPPQGDENPQGSNPLASLMGAGGGALGINALKAMARFI